MSEDFLNAKGLKHKFGDLFHLATNGAAEHGVQVIKHELRKQAEGALKTTPPCLLMAHRCTPYTSTGFPLNELL